MFRSVSREGDHSAPNWEQSTLNEGYGKIIPGFPLTLAIGADIVPRGIHPQGSLGIKRMRAENTSTRGPQHGSEVSGSELWCWRTWRIDPRVGRKSRNATGNTRCINVQTFDDEIKDLWWNWKGNTASQLSSKSRVEHEVRPGKDEPQLNPQVPQLLFARCIHDGFCTCYPLDKAYTPA